MIIQALGEDAERKRARSVAEVEGSGSNRRQEILLAAAEVIATKGFSNATVRDIADSVGILSGSLYHHFDSKDQILVEILQTMLMDLRSTYQGVAAEKLPPADAVTRLMAVGFEALGAWQVQIRILQNEYPYLANQEQFLFLTSMEIEIENIWRSELARGVADGTFRESTNVQLIYRILMGSLLNASRWYRRGGRLSAFDLGIEHARVVLDGIRA